MIADPPGCPSPPQPYEVSAALGVLADGSYVVEWTLGPSIVQGAFSITARALEVPVAPVPALGAYALLILVASLGVAAAWGVHRNGAGAA